MAVFRVHKNKNFTVMSNKHLRDDRLTLKAKGLLSVILSLPDDWNYSINGLASICKEGPTAVKSALSELMDTGYIVMTKLYPNQTESGRIEYIYDIHEEPVQPETSQDIETLYVETQDVENQVQLNKEKPRTDISSKDKQKVFKPPTPKEVRDYAREIGYNIDADYFCDYWQSLGWSRGKTKMKDWRATVRTWVRRDFNRKGGVTWDAELRELADGL